MTPAKPATAPRIEPPKEAKAEERPLTEEERKKRVDAAAEGFMDDNAAIFADLAK